MTDPAAAQTTQKQMIQALQQQLAQAQQTQQQQMMAEFTRLRQDLQAEPVTGEPIRYFRGEAKENFSEWIDEYDLLCLRKGWSEDRRCQALPSFLKGHALEVYRDLNNADKGTYARVIPALKTALEAVQGTAVASTDVLNRKQVVGESVVSYYHALKQQFARSYPKANKNDAFYKSMLFQVFSNGLLPYLQTKIIESGADTIELALDTARKEEAIAEAKNSRGLCQPFLPDTAPLASALPSAPSADVQLIQTLTDLVKDLLIDKKQSTSTPSDTNATNYQPAQSSYKNQRCALSHSPSRDYSNDRKFYDDRSRSRYRQENDYRRSDRRFDSSRDRRDASRDSRGPSHDRQSYRPPERDYSRDRYYSNKTDSHYRPSISPSNASNEVLKRLDSLDQRYAELAS